MSACLGLIGGLGVGAAVHYYRELARAHADTGRVLHLVMIHAEMPRVLQHVAAGERLKLAEYLSELIGRLKAAGADIAVLPAVTPHFCAADLAPISSLPLVSLPEAVAAEIRSRGVHRVALFGTRFVVESRLFDQLPEAEMVTPRAEEVDYIHKTYTQLAQAGEGSDRQRRGLSELARRLCERDGVEAILLAGTDLTLLFDEQSADFPCIDCARAHICAVMARAIASAAQAAH